MNVLTAERREMCFCSGCSHTIVLKRLGEAVERLELPSEKVCLVTDIGCIGIADRYFGCHTFHGLHGRSVTYAEGIARTRPDLLVIVLMGDGGAGIGTAHLVHAARRDARIKVLVCNNFNFGMTGGQHSPTTPLGGISATTPDGSVDSPFDVCGTVAVNGAGYVARHSALDNNVADRIEDALRSPGFALLDLWELCTAYFVPANALKARGLEEYSKRFRLPMGVIQDRSGSIASATDESTTRGEPGKMPGPPARAALPSSAQTLQWCGRAELCVAGSAGQRIRSAVGLLGEIAVAGGLHAAQYDDFPITVRKGHSISSLIIDASPIRYTGVDDPELVVFLSEDGLRRFGNPARLSQRCLVLTERSLELPAMKAGVRRFDAKTAGSASIGLTVLLAGVMARGWITFDQFQSALEARSGSRYYEENLRVLQAANDLFIDSGS